MEIKDTYNFLPMKERIVPEAVEFGGRIGTMNSTASVFSKGSGNEVFKTTSEGIWLGAANFDDAPFSVDMQGNVIARNGTFSGTFNIGGTQITVDTIAEAYTALTTVSNAGGGVVFLDNGTYTLTADITIPSGVTLQGVSRDGVILNCNTSYAVKIAGSNVYSTGTVTINNGDTTVVGSGTTWTAAMIGRFILLDGLWYEITARASNTSITITTYQGDNLAGSAYVLATLNSNASLAEVTVTGATGSGIVVQYAMEPNVFDIVSYGNGTGVDMDYVTFPTLRGTVNENGVNLDFNFVEGFAIDFSEFNFSTTGEGVVMVSSRNATFFNSSVNDNTTNGISITGGTKIAFISVDISGNGAKGIEFIATCNDNQLTDIVLDGNISDNIKLTATSDRNQFIGVSSINAGGYGINIAASTCDGNVINSPTFSNNSSGNINDSGTLTVIIADDTAYNATTWNGNLGVATKNAIRDVIATLAVDADVVHDTGDETIAGVKTFSSDPLIPDEAYGSGWNGVLEPPTKNAVYDKIETLGSIDVQTFTSSGTWTKPSSGTKVLVQAWGGGASGGFGAGGRGGAGGGGGAYVEYIFDIASLGATETVTIGAGGAAKSSAGGGNVGGNTTFGSLLTAYGGGAGGGDGAGGGTGGGQMSVGSSGGSGNLGGSPVGGASGTSGSGPSGTVGQSSFGGGGGGGTYSNAAGAGQNGELSSFGGGGGGGAGNTGGNGGNSLYAGAGGGGGGSTGASTGGTSKYGGNGGAGAFDSTVAGSGVQPGGGGGGSEAGNSGAGGAGKIIVTTF